jgi:hypothetical protein
MLTPIANRAVRLRNWLSQRACWLVDRYRLPDKTLVIITNERSGSTWLFDALRCCPGIRINPRYTILHELGVSARRYPRDLSEGQDAELEIEVRPGSWEQIPPPALNFDNKCSTQAGIEKIHPTHFDFDTKNIIKKSKVLDRYSKFIPIYLIRHPRETITSFLDYRERNSEWYSHVKTSDTAEYFLKGYSTISRMIEQKPGPAIDYSSLKKGFTSVVNSTVESTIGKEASLLVDFKKIKESLSKVKKRRREESNFVGRRIPIEKELKTERVFSWITKVLITKYWKSTKDL